MKNDIIEVIKNQKHEKKLSHAYLIETNDFDMFKYNLCLILKILLCEEDEVYCNKCQSCHYIDNFEHPNIIFIYPDGANIKISQIDNLKKQFNSKPNFGRYNIYVIVGAETLNASSSNALLKFLEEPEEGIIGILLTSNKSLVSPTITSRCQIFNNNFEEDIFSEEIIEIVKSIERCAKSESDLLSYSNLLKQVDDKNKIKIAFAYLLKNEINNDSNIKKINLLKEIVEKMRYNVNMDLLLIDYLIKVRELNE